MCCESAVERMPRICKRYWLCLPHSSPLCSKKGKSRGMYASSVKRCSGGLQVSSLERKCKKIRDWLAKLNTKALQCIQTIRDWLATTALSSTRCKRKGDALKNAGCKCSTLFEKCHLFGDVITARAVVYAKCLPYWLNLIWPECVFSFPTLS